VKQTSFQFNGAVLSFLSCSARIFDLLMAPPSVANQFQRAADTGDVGGIANAPVLALY